MIAEGCRQSIVGRDVIESAASSSAESLTDEVRYRLPVHLPWHLPDALPALEGDCVLWDVL